jgi:hypothetical protein
VVETEELLKRVEALDQTLNRGSKSLLGMFNGTKKIGYRFSRVAAMEAIPSAGHIQAGMALFASGDQAGQIWVYVLLFSRQTMWG